jgi:hypothetical protein
MYGCGGRKMSANEIIKVNCRSNILIDEYVDWTYGYNSLRQTNMIDIYDDKVFMYGCGGRKMSAVEIIKV